MPEQKYDTLSLETYVKHSYNYLNRMVDAAGQPYFNVFWDEPSQAAHDWPDFGDVTSRQLQAAIMARHMTGVTAPIEQVWMSRLISCIDPASGLLYRPITRYSQHVADMGDQALTLYTLVTAYLDNQDNGLRQTITTMVNSLLQQEKSGKGIFKGFESGFIIKSLMTCARALDYSPAVELARMLLIKVFETEPLFSPDNSFRHGGHMHSNLRTLVGAADYALYTHDPILYSRVDALYRYARSTATSFGFMPEAIGRSGDVVSCETCALMDYIGLAVTLANHGHPEYWDDVERVVRNHLIESQVRDATWLQGDSIREDTDQFTWRDIGDRMTGGYAGWTSPTHILAARETLGAHWGGPELKNKTRAFQNCCGGSGTHAFFIAWKNATRYTSGRLDVNLHFDKLLPEAEVRCFQPYAGLTTIALRASATVHVRLPGFTSPEHMLVEANGAEIAFKVWGNRIDLGHHETGTLLKLTYPLDLREEVATIGNPGHMQYRYHVTWKGDTVVKMQPDGITGTNGYSDFDKQAVPTFYGEDGPGRLYQRSQYLEDTLPLLSPLHMDDGALDLWSFGVQ